MINKVCNIIWFLVETTYKFGKEYKLKLLALYIMLLFSVNVEAGNNNIYYMTTGEIKKIPVSFNDRNYYYHSTNQKVMRFTDTGKMHAIKSGDSKVVLTYFDQDNMKVRKKFKVKIHDKVKGIKWKKKQNELNPGDEYTYKVKYKVKSKKNVVLSWSSSNPAVAWVDQNGKVKALSTGTTIIRCKVKGQKNTFVSTKLNVVTVPVSMLSVEKNELTIRLNSIYNLCGTVSVYPENATNKLLNISSQNENVVKVMYGVLYAVGKGQTTVKIEATDGSGCVENITVIVDDWIEREDIHFIAHRGLSSEAPENTIKAFELAGKNGFYGVECDIWLSKDGQFIISHDGNLLRMCGVNKKISDLTLAEIKSIPIKTGANYDLYKNDKSATTIPTLKEYLAVCNMYNVIPMIEVKFCDGSAKLNNSNELYRLFKEISSIMGNKEVYIISFYDASIKNMNSIIKTYKTDNIHLCLLQGECKEISSITMYQYCSENNIGFSVENHTNESVIRKMSADGICVGMWTVDDTANISAYIEWGASFIVTDKVLWKETSYEKSSIN